MSVIVIYKDEVNKALRMVGDGRVIFDDEIVTDNAVKIYTAYNDRFYGIVGALDVVEPLVYEINNWPIANGPFLLVESLCKNKLIAKSEGLFTVSLVTKDSNIYLIDSYAKVKNCSKRRSTDGENNDNNDRPDEFVSRGISLIHASEDDLPVITGSGEVYLRSILVGYRHSCLNLRKVVKSLRQAYKVCNSIGGNISYVDNQNWQIIKCGSKR